MSIVGLSEGIVTLVHMSRLQWYGHVLRRNREIGIRLIDRLLNGASTHKVISTKNLYLNALGVDAV